MENIRNFVIISHIDHGKSTLADRFLELTKTIAKEKMRPQYLDTMDLEKERGITIKMHPVRMIYHRKVGNLTSQFILNLIDTPGHVDFSYEVSRALAAVEGAILLIDVSKGIQAQTIFNLELAKKQKLFLIPAINKIDLFEPEILKERVEEIKKEIISLFNFPSWQIEVFQVSAKLGTNVQELLEAVIKKIPPPQGKKEAPFLALIFDSKYHSYQGVQAFIRVIDGEIKKGDKIFLQRAKIPTLVKEIGIFTPEPRPIEKLGAGEIGWLSTGIKEPAKVRIGETITSLGQIKILAGYQEPKPVIFSSLYPEDPNDFKNLKEGLEKLKLNDSSLFFRKETKETLGRGFSAGFLGRLHLEIVVERLKREFGLNLILSPPQVVFKVIDKKNQKLSVFSPADWPGEEKIKEILEPWAKLEIVTPIEYLGRVYQILEKREAKQIERKELSPGRILLIFELPLREMMVDFYDQLKNQTQGFASMSYEILGERKADLVKLDILVAKRKIPAFSQIVPRRIVQKKARQIVEKLKEILPAQLFSLPLQAAVSGKILARETISPKRKNVIAPLYGGDFSRKKKLLERQKKGKEELAKKAQLRIPPKVFLEFLKIT